MSQRSSPRRQRRNKPSYSSSSASGTDIRILSPFNDYLETPAAGSSADQSSSSSPKFGTGRPVVTKDTSSSNGNAGREESTKSINNANVNISKDAIGDECSERRQPAAAGRKLWTDPSALSSTPYGSNSRKIKSRQQRRLEQRANQSPSSTISRNSDTESNAGRALGHTNAPGYKSILLDKPVILGRNTPVNQQDTSGFASDTAHGNPPSVTHVPRIIARSTEQPTPSSPAMLSKDSSHLQDAADTKTSTHTDNLYINQTIPPGQEHLAKLFPSLFRHSTPTAVKLINKTKIQPEAAFKILSDYPGCFVIGVLGRAGTGKSTVLSGLAGSNPFPIGSNASDGLDPTSLHDSAGQKLGIDLFVTPERVILLDTQAILQSSASSQYPSSPDMDIADDNQKLDPSTQTESSKLALFLMSVCHVILLVSDMAPDAELCKLVRNAELVRSKLYHSHRSTAHVSSTHSRNSSQSFNRHRQPTPSTTSSTPNLQSTHSLDVFQPYIVFVYNKCKTDMLIPHGVSGIWKSFRKHFSDTELNAYNLFARTKASKAVHDYELHMQMRTRKHTNEDTLPLQSNRLRSKTLELLSLKLPICNIACLPYQSELSPKCDFSLSLDDLMAMYGGIRTRYDVLIKQLRDVLLEIPRFPAASLESGSGASRSGFVNRQYMVSERDWLRNAVRTWDNILKRDIQADISSVSNLSSSATGGASGSTDFKSSRLHVKSSRSRTFQHDARNE
ncbi:hypothetical protein BATDEDRAFT_85674 [Batrachochytrium dendrobatidis JAM81]|uniref:Protein SMG9 n=1 Tax=Batrachochytrium dendrobatidis (strain JAM81 / FGSC 10211) TaxID=684364 RepID=F4NRN1_BATDJ|nr:uncharacterized protein BATDEDRAFT_85674 [Batrachochytrium dendrobatidis JAM81]EGF82952.1 hypothetical protein BATDEDRAFT_85674 [Batrachochytrium dendrobatidis JAM81]|eukprot:XP_006675922.1 hypothetical protein BATDEDRAFT_85674 [Batrachochytrium dendrobatidis JAM81]